MKILLAGANGIIGSYLFDALKDMYDVTGIGNEILSKNILEVDLTNKDNVAKFINEADNFDILIFLVGLAHSKGKGADYKKFYDVNVQTLINLLTELKEKEKLHQKIIFASTISVYGEKFKVNEYYEDSGLHPKSPYAKTKEKAEKYLLNNFKNITWILRFAPVYTHEFDLNIKRRTQIFGKFYRVGKGDNHLSLLAIENILRTIKAIIENKVPSGIYNVSDEEQYTFNNLLKSGSAKSIIKIPYFFVYILYYLGKLLDITFFEENSIKLLTNNIYPSKKLQEYIRLDFNLFDK